MVDFADSAKLATSQIVHLEIDHKLYKNEEMNENNINPLLNIGLQYIKFANEEKNLFKFLFQSNKFSNFNFKDLIDNNESDIQSIFDVVQKETNLSSNQIKEMFTILFITAHGIASLLANNSMKYNEEECKKILNNTFNSMESKM